MGVRSLTICIIKSFVRCRFHRSTCACNTAEPPSLYVCHHPLMHFVYGRCACAWALYVFLRIALILPSSIQRSGDQCELKTVRKWEEKKAPTKFYRMQTYLVHITYTKSAFISSSSSSSCFFCWKSDLILRRCIHIYHGTHHRNAISAGACSFSSSVTVAVVETSSLHTHTMVIEWYHFHADGQRFESDSDCKPCSMLTKWWRKSQQTLFKHNALTHSHEDENKEQCKIINLKSSNGQPSDANQIELRYLS